MKLTTILLALSCITTSAFGVKPSSPLVQRPGKVAELPPTSAFHKQAPATQSALFRNQALTRGGAVPGWNAYVNALETSPLIAKSCTSLMGFLLGDLLAQLFIVKTGVDMKRLITLSMFGLLWHGPSGHYFYNWLDNLIPGKDAKAVFSKVAFDQLIWCPIFMIVFFTYLGLCAGDSFSVIGNKIRADLFTACQGSWKVWPFVHAINFRFIPNKFRMIYINAIQIGFNMFLSVLGAAK